MKRLVITLLALSMFALLFAGCNKDSNTSDGQASDTPEKTTFTVGFDQNFPPYGYVDENGDYVGFDIDLATEAADRLGLELVLQPIDWDAKDLELSSGAIDCIWNGFTINGREDQYTWTEAYMDNSQVFVVKADGGISEFSDLAGKVIAVQTDSSAQTALEDNADLTATFAQLMTYADYNTAFMDLESGAVDAIAMDIGVAKYQISGKEDTFVILDEELISEQYGVGFLLGNTELRDKVQSVLEEMVSDSTFADISEKWFGYDVGIIGK